LTTATDLKLSNGITVSLKPTDFKDDEIVMQAQRLGGISNYGIKDYYSAKYAGAIQAAQGYGSFSPTDLQKVLSGKKVSAGGIMGETRDEYRGSSTVKDLETMFQLLYLKVTEPRKDTALISSFIKKQKAAMAMAMANPQNAFIDTLGKFIYNGSIMAPLSVPKPEDFDKINAERAAAIFKERMGDATGMHFVFTGSFKEAEIIPLLEKYIASLPVSGKKITFKDNKLRPKSGNHTFVFNKGKEEKVWCWSFIMALFRILRT
jgi:zinc protease